MSALPGPIDAGALLVIDVQKSFADPAALDWVPADGLASVSAAVECAGALVEAGRVAGLRIVWVSLVQDPTRPWAASLWLRDIETTEWPSASEPCVAGTSGADFYELHPTAGEWRITKERYSAFFGTDLHGQLTGADVDWLLVAGLTTECCVMTTVFDAAQLGYNVVLAEDATASYEVAVHEAAVAALTMHAAKRVSTGDALAELALQSAPGVR